MESDAACQTAEFEECYVLCDDGGHDDHDDHDDMDDHDDHGSMQGGPGTTSIGIGIKF